MISIHLLLAHLNSCVTEACISQDVLPDSCVGAALFNPLVPCTVDCIYVADFTAFSTAVEKGFLPPNGCSLFLSDTNVSTENLSGRFIGCNLIFCSMPLFELHCVLSEAMKRYTSVIRALMHSSRNDASTLLQQCTKFLHLSLSFADTQLKKVLQSFSAEEAAADSFLFSTVSDGYAFSDCYDMFPGFPPTRQPLLRETDAVYVVIPLLQDDVPLGYLFAAGQGQADVVVQNALLCSRLLLDLLKGNMSYSTKHGIAMNKLIRDLCSHESMSEDSFRSQMALLKNRTYKFCKIALIRFDDSIRINPQEVFLEAVRTFHNDNLTWYENQIFVLISSPSFHCNSSTGEDRIEEYLSHFHGYMMVSNTSQNVRGLQQMCLQVLNSTDMAWQMNQQLTTGRIMHFSDYSVYHVIDLFSREYKRIYGHDDIMFLCHPSIVALMRYDHAKDAKLCDFLLFFLIHDHNIAKTATHFYMHRNTAIYQRDKIAKMIRYQFDDPSEDFRLVFSLYLTNYRKYYQNLPIQVADFDKTEY